MNDVKATHIGSTESDPHQKMITIGYSENDPHMDYC